METIYLEENIESRISAIYKAAKEYGVLEEFKKHLLIDVSEKKIAYKLDIRGNMFSEYPDFFKKFQEMGFSTTGEEGVRVRSYSYHGQHKTNHTENFIRFDFEPLKRKYPPIHINAHPQIWGDHLVYPDDTNLDISKMSCSLSFKIFYRYAKDPRDFPINKETNEPYREFFDEEENGYART